MYHMSVKNFSKKSKMICVRLPNDLKARLHFLGIVSGLGQGYFITNALRDAIAEFESRYLSEEVHDYVEEHGREKIPLEVLRRVCSGMRPYQAWREYLGLTTEQVADSICLDTRSYEDMENRKEEESRDVGGQELDEEQGFRDLMRQRLADVFGIDFDLLHPDLYRIFKKQSPMFKNRL
jgi:predicted DNA-binding protein